MIYIDNAEAAVADQRAHVGLEVNGHAVGEAAAPGHADAELPAHEAVGSVGRDQVAGVHPSLRATVARA